MSTLSDFLLTANEQDEIALEEAKAHEVMTRKMVTSEQLTMLLVKHGVYATFAAITDNDAVLATMDRIRTYSDFNFFPEDPEGQANLLSVDMLIQASLLTEAFKTDVLEKGCRCVKPFENVTLHQIKIARNRDMLQEVNVVGQYARIELAQDAPELHNPRLLVMDEWLGKPVRISNFAQVKEAGRYQTVIPAQYRGQKLFVDNAYGVVLARGA